MNSDESACQTDRPDKVGQVDLMDEVDLVDEGRPDIKKFEVRFEKCEVRTGCRDASGYARVKSFRTSGACCGCLPQRRCLF